MKSILRIYKFYDGRIYQILSKLNVCFVFLIATLQFLGCYPVQQANSTSAMTENKPVNNMQEKVAETPINNTKIVDSELERNRRLWLGKKIVNYNFTAKASQSGMGNPADSVLIEVRDGKATLIEPMPKVDTVRLQIYKDFDTIDKMFDAIQQGLEKEALVEVKYNKDFGYPEEWHVNFYKKGSDYSKGMKIDKFELLK